jgi:hypothetical protein
MPDQHLVEIALNRVIQKLSTEIFVWNSAAVEFQTERDQLRVQLQEAGKLLEKQKQDYHEVLTQRDNLRKERDFLAPLIIEFQSRILLLEQQLWPGTLPDPINPSDASTKSIPPIESIPPKEE